MVAHTRDCTQTVHNESAPGLGGWVGDTTSQHAGQQEAPEHRARRAKARAAFDRPSWAACGTEGGVLGLAGAPAIGSSRPHRLQPMQTRCAPARGESLLRWERGAASEAPTPTPIRPAPSATTELPALATTPLHITCKRAAGVACCRDRRKGRRRRRFGGGPYGPVVMQHPARVNGHMGRERGSGRAGGLDYHPYLRLAPKSGIPQQPPAPPPEPGGAMPTSANDGLHGVVAA